MRSEELGMRNEQSCPQAPSEAILRRQDLPEYL